jgi:DNA-directed RNA polymerase specialized sigma24 family protein
MEMLQASSLLYTSQDRAKTRQRRPKNFFQASGFQKYLCTAFPAVYNCSTLTMQHDATVPRSEASEALMSSADCVTHWIQQIKDGDHAAVQKLLEHYFQRLIHLARKKLHLMPQLVDYGEDVALSAFKSLVLGAQRDRFARLQDREDLWRLLVVLTVRKAIDLLRKEGRAQHGGEVDVAQVLSREPTPEMAVQMADECRRLLNRLGNQELRSIALWKMEGYSNEEIAGKLDCVLRTVERRLQLIRQIWETEIAS